MLNKHGVHTSPEEFYRETKNGTETILKVGEHNGAWGYECTVMGKREGFACPCMPERSRLQTREQAMAAARLRAGVAVETQLTLWPV